MFNGDAKNTATILIKCFIVHIHVDRQELFVQTNQSSIDGRNSSKRIQMNLMLIAFPHDDVSSRISVGAERSKAKKRDGCRSHRRQQAIRRGFESSSNPVNWNKSINLMTFDDNRKTIRMDRSGRKEGKESDNNNRNQTLSGAVRSSMMNLLHFFLPFF